MDNNQEKPDIPEALQKSLTDALQEIAMLVHKACGTSHVIINLEHVSDALAGSGQTKLNIGAVGIPMQLLEAAARKAAEKAATELAGAQKDLTPEEKTKYVDDIVTKMMNEAKKKGESEGPKTNEEVK